MGSFFSLSFDQMIYNSMFILVVVVLTLIIIRTLFPRKGILLYMLYVWHSFFTYLRYQFTLNNANDSTYYYFYALNADSWLDLLGISRFFVSFLVYPFAVGLDLDFLSITFLFSSIGFLGLCLTIGAFDESALGGYKKILFVLCFLPSLHFWSSGIGKDVFVFFALGLILYQLSKTRPSVGIVLVGIGIGTLCRPHIGLMLALAVLLQFAVFNGNISIFRKFLLCSVGFCSVVFSLVVFRDQMDIGSANDIQTHILSRQESWVEAGSTINLSSYSFVERIITFTFRPLFFDAYSSIMFLVSFENLLLIFTTIYIVVKGFSLGYRMHSPKVFFSITFLVASIILYSTVTANLGTAARKKMTLFPAYLVLVSVYSGQPKRQKKYA